MNLPNPLSLIVLGHIHKDERVYYFDELKVKGSKKSWDIFCVFTITIFMTGF
jgi:hypothetical protein